MSGFFPTTPLFMSIPDDPCETSRMKRILAPILLLTLLFPSLAYGLTMDDLVERDGLYYKKFTEVPFTGKTTGQKQGSFKNGKKNGPWFIYWENGQLWEKGIYKDGKEHGPRVVYYSTGQLGSKGTYKNGKRDGPWVHYHGDGQLSSKETHKDGKSNGPFVRYWDNGQLYSKGTYKNGKREGPWAHYLKNGTKRFTRHVYGVDEGSGTYKNGVKVK